MGSAKLNPLLLEFHGKIGGLSFAKYGDTYRVRKLPTGKVKPPTELQKAVRRKLAEGVRYARSVLAQPELKAVYTVAGKLKGKRAYDVAKADFMNPPAIVEIDLSQYTGQMSEVIRIQAVDDMEVVSVRVRILDMEGATLETGEASAEPATGWWRYAGQGSIQAGKVVMIEVTAADRPDNRAIKRVDHLCGPRT